MISDTISTDSDNNDEFHNLVSEISMDTLGELDERRENISYVNEDDIYIPLKEKIIHFFDKRRICALITIVIIIFATLIVIGSIIPSIIVPRKNHQNNIISSTDSSDSEIIDSSIEYTEFSTVIDDNDSLYYFTNIDEEDFIPFIVPNPPDPSNEFIRNSMEYQITYSNLDFWIDRDTMVYEYTQTSNILNPYLNMSINDGKVSVRHQYKISTEGPDKCYNNRNIRVREYNAGVGAGTSYIDIKANAFTKEQACNVPYWPADNYYNNSRSKCEIDVHQCQDKYSHETRIYFDSFQNLNTCYDLIQLYPWAFDELPPEEQYHTIEGFEYFYWWTILFSGQMNNSTNYEIAFTLRYSSKSDALAGNINPPIYGEWSIRIYSLNDGASEEYDEDVKDSAWDLWNNLSLIFGNKDNFGHCM